VKQISNLLVSESVGFQRCAVRAGTPFCVDPLKLATVSRSGELV
jgi:hypothetical protein